MEAYIKTSKQNHLGIKSKDAFYRFTFRAMTLEEDLEKRQLFTDVQDFKDSDLLKARIQVVEHYVNTKKRILDDGFSYPVPSFKDHVIGENSAYSTTIEFVIPDIEGEEDAGVIFGETWNKAKDCIATELKHFEKNDLETSELFWINQEVLFPESFKEKYEHEYQQMWA